RFWQNCGVVPPSLRGASSCERSREIIPSFTPTEDSRPTSYATCISTYSSHSRRDLRVPGSSPLTVPILSSLTVTEKSNLRYGRKGPIEDAISHLRGNGILVELGPVKRFGAGGEGTSVYFRDLEWFVVSSEPLAQSTCVFLGTR